MKKNKFTLVILIILILALFLSCKKQDNQTEQTPDTEIKFHFTETAYQVHYWYQINGYYDDGTEYYFSKSRTQPIDTVITVKGKLTKVIFQSAITGGNGNMILEVYKDGAIIDFVNQNEHQKIYYVWQ